MLNIELNSVLRSKQKVKWAEWVLYKETKNGKWGVEIWEFVLSVEVSVK